MALPPHILASRQKTEPKRGEKSQLHRENDVWPSYGSCPLLGITSRIGKSDQKREKLAGEELDMP
jgi:hypothetical protein